MTQVKGNRKLALLFILLSIVWVGILFTESSQPPAKIMGEVYGLDKVAHFVAFGVLSVLLCLVSLSVRRKSKISFFSLPLLGIALLGLMEEGYQISVPGRSGSGIDLLADLLGGVAAIILVNAVIGIRKKYSQKDTA